MHELPRFRDVSSNALDRGLLELANEKLLLVLRMSPAPDDLLKLAEVGKEDVPSARKRPVDLQGPIEGGDHDAVLGF